MSYFKIKLEQIKINTKIGLNTTFLGYYKKININWSVSQIHVKKLLI